MITIHGGNTFQLNADGTQLVCGYETVKHVDLLTGVETPWPRNGQGAFYPCGWLDDDRPAVFQPTNANPPETQAYGWLLPDTTEKFGLVEEAVGHAGLAVIDGQTLSTNGAQIFFNGRDITPEPFAGVVWDGTHYGYHRFWDASGGFAVLRVADNGPVRAIPYGGMYERPYTLSDGVWVTGHYPGGSKVYAPNMALVLPGGELCGPVFERGFLPYVVSCVMGRGQNPRGVMVRPWSELVTGTLKGWYLDGVRHQSVQARVRPDSTLVIAGGEFPGSGIITVATIEPGRAMALVPEEIDLPPVEKENDDMNPELLKALADLHSELLATKTRVATIEHREGLERGRPYPIRMTTKGFWGGDVVTRGKIEFDK